MTGKCIKLTRTVTQNTVVPLLEPFDFVLLVADIYCLKNSKLKIYFTILKSLMTDAIQENVILDQNYACQQSNTVSISHKKMVLHYSSGRDFYSHTTHVLATKQC